MSVISRMYTGDDGETHIEEMELDDHPELKSVLVAKGVTFRVGNPGEFHDFHNAPRRQFVITLQGEVEIGLGDGTTHRFAAGHVNLAEDLTGRGHTTRVTSQVPRITATVHLEG